MYLLIHMFVTGRYLLLAGRISELQVTFSSGLIFPSVKPGILFNLLLSQIRITKVAMHGTYFLQPPCKEKEDAFR